MILKLSVPAIFLIKLLILTNENSKVEVASSFDFFN